MSTDSGPGTREVAYRLFAAEFEDSTVSYSESDEERAPNYVITPTGGRVNRLFLAGVLTETERVGGEQLRGRVVDPTGAFVAYAGQYQPDELAFLDRVDPPAFLAVTGKARTFSPEDSDRVYTSVRPESISEVDAETRDRWVVRTAEQTLDRVATMASALHSDLRGEALRDRLVEEEVDAGLASGVALAVEHYGTTSAYLQALRGTALDAVRVVAGDRDEVDRLDLAPDEGGTEDAVLAGLATMDLGVTTPTPGVAAGEPAATATGDAASSEPAASAESGSADATPAETTTDDTATGTTTDDTATEQEPTTEPEPESEPTTATSTPETEPAGTGETVEAGSGDRGTDTGSTGTTTPADEMGSAGTDEVDGSGSTGATEPDEPPADADEEFEDFEPGEFELPEAEREEIEEEFGTDFETAGEVDPAGEAGIETPESEEPTAGAGDGDAAASTPETEPIAEPETTAEPGAKAAAGTEAEPDADAGSEPEHESEPERASAADEGASDAEAVDVDEVTVETIAELDDGDGADREAVVETVSERHGVDPEAVADAIESAMMSGRAYEPSDGRLKAI